MVGIQRGNEESIVDVYENDTIARQNSEQSREVFQTGHKVDGHVSVAMDR